MGLNVFFSAMLYFIDDQTKQTTDLFLLLAKLCLDFFVLLLRLVRVHCICWHRKHTQHHVTMRSADSTKTNDTAATTSINMKQKR